MILDPKALEAAIDAAITYKGDTFGPRIEAIINAYLAAIIPPDAAGLVARLRMDEPPTEGDQEDAADAIEAMSAREAATRAANLHTQDWFNNLRSDYEAAEAKVAARETEQEDLQYWLDYFGAQIDEARTAVEDHWFLDPPDGGAVTLAEGVKRIDAARVAAEASAARMREALRKIAKPRGAIWSPDAHEVAARWRSHVSDMQRIANEALADAPAPKEPLK